MSENEGNQADSAKSAGSASNVGGSHKPRPSYHNTEHFLIVNIEKDSSKDDLVKAVEKALRAYDVPFLATSITPHQEVVSGQEAGGLEQAQYPTDPAHGYRDTLLMLVRTEGW